MIEKIMNIIFIVEERKAKQNDICLNTYSEAVGYQMIKEAIYGKEEMNDDISKTKSTGD